MTMDDDQIDYFPEPRSLEERQAMAAALPWVAHAPLGAGRCQAIKGKAPLKAYWDRKTGYRVPDDHPDRVKHQCKGNAYWVFVSARGEIRNLCWTHLMYRGLLGSMEEEERLRKWDEEHA